MIPGRAAKGPIWLSARERKKLKLRRRNQRSPSTEKNTVQTERTEG